VVTDMWNSSSLGQVWQFVATTIEMKYGVRLGALSREVYTALKASKGSQEALQQLIK
jgi:hypothetical protein